MVHNYKSLSKRHTVTLDDVVYSRLKTTGKFGESFSALISRILDELQVRNSSELS